MGRKIRNALYRVGRKRRNMLYRVGRKRRNMPNREGRRKRMRSIGWEGKDIAQMGRKRRDTSKG